MEPRTRKPEGMQLISFYFKISQTHFSPAHPDLEDAGASRVCSLTPELRDPKGQHLLPSPVPGTSLPCHAPGSGPVQDPSLRCSHQSKHNL